MINVNIITSRFSHHAEHSGYDQIARFIKEDLKARVFSVPEAVAHYVPWPAVKRFVDNSGLYGVGYRVRSFYAEELVMKNILTKNGEIYHFIYGENNYRYAGLFNNIRKNRIVASFHFPPNLLEETIPNRRYLKRLSAVIALGRKQHSYFVSMLGQDNVHFVPHGIDTSFFHPASAKRGSNLCLCTGMHLRDYPMLSRAAKLVHEKNKNIEFVVVSDNESRHFFSGMPYVKFLSGISEKYLLGLYQNAGLFVLPLVDCAANNALLEAMACGLPILTTSAGDIRDYANEDCAVFARPGNAEAFADNILKLLGDNKRLEEMSVMARKKALEFDWHNVARQVASVYKKII